MVSPSSIWCLPPSVVITLLFSLSEAFCGEWIDDILTCIWPFNPDCKQTWFNWSITSEQVLQPDGNHLCEWAPACEVILHRVEPSFVIPRQCDSKCTPLSGTGAHLSKQVHIPAAGSVSCSSCESRTSHLPADGHKQSQHLFVLWCASVVFIVFDGFIYFFVLKDFLLFLLFMAFFS